MSQDVVFGRKELLGLPEPEVQKVYIEGFGGSVYMKPMSALDQDTYEWSLVEFVDAEDGTQKVQRNMDAMRAKYLVRTLCDSKGKRLFKDDEYTLLGQKFPKTIAKLHTKALEINGAIREEEETRRKNSDTGSSNDSNSDSA